MTDNRNHPHTTALEDRQTAAERLFSPSAARNREPIRDAFLKHMPTAGSMLEIGGGTGEHGVFLAEVMPGATWLTGDPDPDARLSIAAWIAHAKLSNLSGPHAIDVTQTQWGVENQAPFNALISINMIHIAPFAAAKGLFAGAQRVLSENGKLFLYGPFSRNGAHTAPSNERFHASLKSRNRAWGVRDIEQDLAPLAHKHALSLSTIVEMPANNFAVIFSKT